MGWHIITEGAPIRENIDIIWVRIKSTQDFQNNKNSPKQYKTTTIRKKSD